MANMEKIFYDDNQEKVSFPDWIHRVARGQNDKDKGRDEEGAGSGKIKKSKEIRKGLPTLTFSGG